MNETTLISNALSRKESLTVRFRKVRQRSVSICQPLSAEDYVVQPVEDVSPPKWHLGHTTWFFETFILSKDHSYSVFNDRYNFVFNSYYESIGKRVIKTDRGNLSRPSVEDVYEYRSYVDENMERLLAQPELDSAVLDLLELGLNHEEQHQELLITDIKFVLGHNPLFPKYDHIEEGHEEDQSGFLKIDEGKYMVGHNGDGFHFDNERGQHAVWLHETHIAKALVTNKEYLDFVLDRGYQRFEYWHAAGWQWVKENNISSPLYWHEIDGQWMNYSLKGLTPIELDQPLAHVSYYEAFAFAMWKGMRIPTEFEWEIASKALNWGQRWEWTQSAYLPYPGFIKAPGAIGEYNGKFMVNQMVLRGSSIATPQGHSRPSYRNFFYAQNRWQYTGVRLAKHHQL